MAKRTYDLVVFGATGFTGRGTAEYLAEHAPEDLRWALAGRSMSKLEMVRGELATIKDRFKNLDILIADSSNRDSLDQVIKQTRVVLTAFVAKTDPLGPYAKYGTPLVASCVENKTHYVDVTGEYRWIKTIVDQFHEKAVANDTLIVPCCGFDSVPADMGTFMCVDYIREKYGKATESVVASVTSLKSGVSGGTIASAVEHIGQDERAGKSTFDPYYLSPVRGLQNYQYPTLSYDKDLKKWQAYFVMAGTNEKVVQRSNGLRTLAGQGYGKLFRHRETISTSFFGAALITAFLITGLPLFAFCLKVGFIRNIIAKFLPQPGSGPSKEAVKNGSFEYTFIAQGETEPYEDPIKVKGIVKGFSDPYGETCRMVAEAALCALYNDKEIPGKGGVLTPATAFGQPYITRLREDGRGMVFDVQPL